MAEIHRRQLLLGTTALAASLVSGVTPAAAAPEPSFDALSWRRVEIPVPAWAVGTDGEWDWDVVRAWTCESARIEWARRQEGGRCENALRTARSEYGAEPRCGCSFCTIVESTTATRKKVWDGRDVVAGDCAWFRAGMGSLCDNCSVEVYSSDARVIGDRIVCYDCTDEDEDEENPQA